MAVRICIILLIVSVLMLADTYATGAGAPDAGFDAQQTTPVSPSRQ